MRHPTIPLLFTSALLALFPSTLAQSSGVLQSPNSPLPSCASSCGILQQAATACGGLTASSQNIWVCFCQSTYLTTLYQSGEGTCADTCATAAQRDTLRVWYKGECGTDKGFSEHAGQGQGGGSGQGTTTVVMTSTSTSAGGAAATSGTGGTSGGSVTSGISQGQSGGWFKLHWKWILMLILLFVLLLLIALIAVWWKRRHDRKQDLVTSSFNPGITSRSVPRPAQGPEMGEAQHHASGSMLGFDGTSAAGGTGGGTLGGAAAGAVGGSGRHTPTRTRDAYMPYGYGYARSESRPASQSYVDQSDTIQSVAESGRGGEAGRGAGEGAYAGEVVEGSAKKGKGRVLVRERDAR
ncbi:hypothetical protein B0A48_17277 [Cryoendolithus antarcticus]|uniref:WSC domain-containing protein n=1 Tax=Cryoendolithus antarcticus TaxID=1507870 RepID=A0A1V8SC80_9PEZI|nr:hypothetical protein B0A48_17277 [Cryoendolithus antarcticus]